MSWSQQSKLFSNFRKKPPFLELINISLTHRRGLWMFVIGWENWIELKLTSVYSSVYWKQKRAATTGKGIMKMMAWLSTEILLMSMKISWKNHSIHMCPFSSVSSHSKKNCNLTFFCPAAAACNPLQSLSADRLMPASTIRNPSDKFKIFMFLFVDWGSASSASLWKISFRISTRHYRIHSWKWDNWKKLSAFASIKLGSSFIIVGLGSNHIKLRTIGEAKIRKILYFLFSVKIAHIVIIIFR